MNFKLRNRIAFYYMTATAVFTALLFIIIYAVVQNTIYNHLQDELAIENAEVQSGIHVDKDSIQFINLYEWEEREHGQVEVNPTFIEVLDKKGTLIKKTDNLLEENLEFLPSITKKVYLKTKLSNNSVYEVQIPLTNQDGSLAGFLLLGMPLEEANHIMVRLERVLIIGYFASLIFLFFVTRWTAGKSILPIHKVITTASHISRENISERIELPANKDEIYTLTKTINDLLDRLQDAVRREKQFTADASHEMRTPLSVIKGTLEVLIRKPRDIEQYQEKISYCINEVNRMTKMLDQLLLLTRYESGRIEPNIIDIDLNVSILYLILRLDHIAKEKGIKINFKEDEIYHVKADASMMDVVLENLLSNALKYSNGNKQVDIILEKKEGKTLCSIKDYGIGMEKEQITKIFDRFYRTDSARSTRYEGDGIGLAIVKRLVEIQNLKINYESEPNKGTTATITFNE